jgi:hypothetical protein
MHPLTRSDEQSTDRVPVAGHQPRCPVCGGLLIALRSGSRCSRCLFTLCVGCDGADGEEAADLGD